MKKMRDRRTVSESEGAAYQQGGSDASLEMFRDVGWIYWRKLQTMLKTTENVHGCRDRGHAEDWCDTGCQGQGQMEADDTLWQLLKRVAERRQVFFVCVTCDITENVNLFTID